jgi:hypothetical protein
MQYRKRPGWQCKSRFTGSPSIIGHIFDNSLWTIKVGILVHTRWNVRVAPETRFRAKEPALVVLGPVSKAAIPLFFRCMAFTVTATALDAYEKANFGFSVPATAPATITTPAVLLVPFPETYAYRIGVERTARGQQSSEIRGIEMGEHVMF